jgi:hypothetical protein
MAALAEGLQTQAPHTSYFFIFLPTERSRFLFRTRNTPDSPDHHLKLSCRSDRTSRQPGRYRKFEAGPPHYACGIKTDKIDAGVLAQLYASGFLPGVWITDEPTQALRR